MIRHIAFCLFAIIAALPAFADDYEIIDQQPQGQVSYYDRISYGWYIYAGGNNLQYGEVTGSSKIVWGDDNTVYIQNPLTANRMGTYIKAQLDGDKITAQFPQVLGMIEDNNGERPLYIGKMVTLINENGLTYIPATENDVITWTIQPDGIITMDHDPVELNDRGKFPDSDSFPTDVLGTYYYGVDDLSGEYCAIWNAVADWAQTYTPLATGEITVIPEGLNIEAWRMSSKTETRMVDVAFDGDVVYIGNLTPYVPGAIKGYIEDDKVIFPTTQYMGFNEQYNANAWFISAVAVYVKYFGKEYLDHFDRTDALVMKFDREKKKFSSERNDCFLINASTTSINHFEYIVDPGFIYLPPKGMNANPKNPIIIDPGTPQGFDGLLFSVNIPAENIDNVALNTNKMYYNIYLNGELWTFYTDTYYYFPYDITNIPYSFTDRFDIQIRGTTHNIYLHEEGIETIGIVSCFEGNDGVTYSSDMVISTVGGINSAVADRTVVSEEYYTILGQRVEANRPGIYIKVTKYDDGTVSSTKTVKQ